MLLLDIGEFTHELPDWLNILINITLMLGAGYFAVRAFRSRADTFAAGFAMFGIGQVFYITHHLGWTELLFVHLLGDSTVFVSFVFMFVGLLRHGIVPGWDAERSSGHTSD